MREVSSEEIQQNLGLVFMVASRYKRYRSSLQDFEDLVNDGTLGLIHALQHFKPETGNRFSSYAVRCIWGALLTGHRRLFSETWRAKESGMNPKCFSLPTEEGEGTPLNDAGETAEDILHQTSIRRRLAELVRIASPKQRILIEALLKHDMNQAEAARSLGCTRQNVRGMLDQLAKRARLHDKRRAA